MRWLFFIGAWRNLNCRNPCCIFTATLSDLESHLSRLRQFEPDLVVDMIPFREEEAQRVRWFKGTARRGLILSSADVYLGYGRLWNTEPLIQHTFSRIHQLRTATFTDPAMDDEIRLASSCS